MGYDMRIRGWSGKDSYYGLNCSGTSALCEAMYRLEMLWMSRSPMQEGDWKEWDQELAAVDEDAAFAKLNAEMEPLLARPGLAREGEVVEAGIPSHKFSSNDGWVVTREEIEGALKTLREAEAGEVLGVVMDSGLRVELWNRWVDFLKNAVQKGDGFYVR